MRGNITHPVYAGRAKEYAWNLLLEFAPRKITPTDIDFMLECNHHFLFFEMKTVGHSIPFGQRQALERLLSKHIGSGLLIVVHHDDLERVVLPMNVIRYDMWTASKVSIKRVNGMPADSFIEMYEAFFCWAEGHKNAIRNVIREWDLFKDLESAA